MLHAERKGLSISEACRFAAEERNLLDSIRALMEQEAQARTRAALRSRVVTDNKQLLVKYESMKASSSNFSRKNPSTSAQMKQSSKAKSAAALIAMDLKGHPFGKELLDVSMSIADARHFLAEMGNVRDR